MSEQGAREQAAWAAVDDALRTWPMAPVPPTLQRATMARIRSLGAAPRFRLAWLDWALSLFAATMVELGFALWRSIPPEVLLEARIELWLWLERLQAWLAWHLVPRAGLATLLVGAAVLSSLFPLYAATQRRRP